MLRKRIRNFFLLFPAVLARLGLVDRQKGENVFDLALPVMVSDGMRSMLLTIDFFMLSLAVGEAAIAGVEMSILFYFIALGLALALTSGTISVVSRFKGSGDHEKANLAIKQSLWLGLLISVPIAVISWELSTELIGLMTNDPRVVAEGAIYMKLMMLSIPARFWTLIAVRALTGAGDTRTPMYIRMLSVPTNVGLNAALIFGIPALGVPSLGVAGAALGTSLTRVLLAGIFMWLLVSGRRSVQLRLDGKQWETGIAYEIVRVGLPMTGKLLRDIGRFPFLFVLGTLGTSVVAAYAIGRRVMLLAMIPGWGFSTASSTLVGQAIGAGDDQEAEDYGWQTLRIALATQLSVALVLVVFARPIAGAFGTDNLELTVQFIRVFGIGIIGYSFSEVMRGCLRGAGDTRWPLLGSLVGTYVLRLPIVFLALPTGVVLVSFGGITIVPGLGLGEAAISLVFVSILADTYGRGVINLIGFWTGRWKVIARNSNVGVGSEATTD